MKSLVFAIASSLTLGVCADTVYVDDDNYGKSGLDGSSEELAWGTIQDAVEHAPGGSTILVLPGTYDKGGALHNDYSNRVVVTGKKLTIRSTGGKAVTSIVGALDPDDTVVPGRGIGPKAVRALKLYGSASRPVVVEGFTITGGSVHSGKDGDANYGSAVQADGPSVYVVDCDICNNFGGRGITYKGTYLRCLFHDNLAGKGTANFRGFVHKCGSRIAA